MEEELDNNQSFDPFFGTQDGTFTPVNNEDVKEQEPIAENPVPVTQDTNTDSFFGGETTSTLDFLNNPTDDFENDITFEDELEEEEETSFLGAAASDVGSFVTSGDIVYRPLEGIAKGVEEVTQFVEETGEFLQDVTGIGGVQFGRDPETDKFVFRYLNAQEWRDQDIKDSLIRKTEELAEGAQEAIPDAETMTGAVVEGISQFATGFVLARRATGVGGVTGTLTNSAIADATAFDPYEQNISAMLQENEWMRNSFTEALANDEDSSAFVNRLRNAGEGLIVGGTLELAGAMYKAARATRNAKDEVIVNGEVSETAAKEFDSATDELEAMTKKLQEEADAFLQGSKPEEEVVKKARETYKKKYDIEAARANTAIEAAEQKELAFKVATNNQDIARELIENFERKLVEDGMQVTKVSREVDGKLEIDPDLAREASREKTNKLVTVKQGGLGDYVFGKSEVDVDEAINLSMSEGEMFSAILKPEKFDAIVSIAAKYKNQYSDVWNDSGETIIDKLFNLTVDKKIIGGEELITDLAKYGLTFEDYVMTVVSSASEAGRTLQKLSALKRQRPLSAKEDKKMKELMEQQDTIRKTFMRIENIRRGMMVSQVATAARNLQSTMVRAPLETLGNVMDDSLVAFTEGGFGGFARTFSSRDTWKRSFQHMDLMFRNPSAAKQYTQLFFEQPELLERGDEFYNALADMQLKMGRGQASTKAGKVVDYALSMGEDASALLNTPNRWQEYMTRNAMFLSTMERLVKREWDIDLIEAVNDGKIRDIMSDAGSVRPDGARSIIDIADEAIYDAMDLTYAARPQLKVFNDLNNLIVRNGLTAAIPFPRFMFKSMELLGKYAAGASVPLTRMAMRATKRALGSDISAKDVRSLTRGERDAIGKNMQGLALIGAGIWYRSGEDVPEDYYLMNADDGMTFDTSAIFPLRPVLMIGELVKQIKQGTLERFLERNPQEIAEVLTGQNFRAGPSGFMLDDIVTNVFGDSEINANTVRSAGGALGNYFSTFLVPYGQLIDAARAGGFANNEYKDQAPEPTLDKSEVFFDNVQRPFTSRYYTAPEAPNREMVLQEDMDRKRMGAKVLAGINFKAADPEYARWLKSHGYTEFYLGSNSRSPSQRRSENVYIREALKQIVPTMQELEADFQQEWSYKDEMERDGMTFKEAYEAQYLGGKGGFEAQLRKLKNRVREATNAELTEELRAYMAINKLSRSQQRRARNRYQIIEGKAPDMSDPMTVQKVAALGKK